MKISELVPIMRERLLSGETQEEMSASLGESLQKVKAATRAVFKENGVSDRVTYIVKRRVEMQAPGTPVHSAREADEIETDRLHLSADLARAEARLGRALSINRALLAKSEVAA